MKLEFRWLESKNGRQSEPLTPKTVWAINLLLKQLSPGHYRERSAEYLEKCLAAGALLLLASDQDAGGLIVGMAALTPVVVPSHSHGHVDDVVVDEGYRGRGISRELMERLHARARDLQLAALQLSSNPKRVAANKLYQSLGYKIFESNHYRFNLE